MQGDPTKDSLYYAVSEYERYLNPNVSESQVSQKASSARQNPEQYFAETYKKIKGTNIDEATINRVKETTGIQLDINKLKRTDVNHVDNDKRDLLNLGKELETINSQYGVDIEADEKELKDHFNKNIYNKLAQNSRTGILPDYNKTYEQYLSKQRTLKGKYDEASSKRDELYQKAKGDLKPVSVDKFFKDAEKLVKGDVATGNNAREVRQNAYLDSERYFGLLATDFQEKQSKISDPLEQKMASLILEGKKPEIPEGFQPTKEFKDWAKSFENLAEQKAQNVSVFGTEIEGRKMTYSEQLEEHRSIQEENRDENQNWFTKGKDKYSDKYNIPSITRTWTNGTVLRLISGIGDIMDPAYTSKLENEASEALENNDYDKYLKVQKQLGLKDFTDAKGFQIDTGQRSDITAPVWERYVEVDGHRIAVDNKGNVQRVVTDKGFTVHNLSQAEKNAIAKYQQNPKGFKIDEGFGKSWGKAVINMAGTSAVDMIPMIAGGMATAPLRSFGMAGRAASTVVSSAPMFTNIYGQEFKQHFAETGDWTESSTYATAMASVESLAEYAGGITPARFTDALAGRPVRDVITAAGRRAASAAASARGVANFSFAKEFVTQLAKDVGQEEAEELFTMFAQNTIQNVYGKDSEIDMNEVLSTVLVTPLATAPFSVITNAANYRTPGAYRDMINSAADNFEKTEEIFSEIGAQMSQGKSESQKKKITDELKAKMDLISHVRDRKDFYAGNTAFQNIDFQPNELENIEHFIFEEALAKANGKDVDHSEKIKPIIAAAKKRGLLNAAKEEENPLVEDLDDPQNSGDIDFQENDFGDFSEEEWSDYVDNGNVTEERLYSIAEKVKAKDTLSDRERAVFANNTSKINNILKGVKEDTGNPYITSEEFVEPEVDVAAIERRKAEKQSNRLKKQEYLFNGKKDKDGFVTWNTVGIDGSYESISNDFEANNSDHRILFNVDHDSAQNLAVEAIDIARQTGIPIRIDISKADNVTDAPLRVSFRTPDDAKTFHNLMTQSRVYGSAVGLGSANEIGHRLDKKSQYSDKKIKSIEKARHIFDNAQSEDGVYYYNDNGDIVGFTDQEINELAELIDSPKKTWENAGSREFSETVEPIQSSPASRVGTDNRANAVNDSLRNPEQVETRETDKNGVQKIKGKTDLTLGAAFEFKPGERKEIEVYRKGKKGILSVNEGGQVTFEAGNTIEEVGNIEELKESTFGEKGFIIPNELAVNKKGQIVVGHRYFINPYSHAESAINLNEDGSIESVDVVERILFTGQLVKRVFTGQEAIDIATALVVNELKYNGDYKTFFENYTPTYEDTRLIPSNLTVDRIAQELLPHFNGNARMAMETAKMYSMVARNMHLKNPEQYPSPGQYIIDRVLRINNIEMEFQGLISYLEKMAQNPSLTQEEKEDLLYEVDRIKRINVEEEQKIQDSLNKNELIDEIQKLPLTHVRLDKTGNTGMGSQEMTGTYLSTEVGGNRYFNSMAIENGAELFDAKVDVKSPYDVEAKGEDIYVIMQLMLPLAVGKYIYEKALSPDLSDLLKNVQFLDDPILEAFPDFADYVAQEVTNSFIEQGYDSFYSRESNEREGYLVVFNKASVKLTPHDMKSMIPDENTETLEDLKSRNEEEYNALISGESAERRKSGVATQDGIVYKRAESLPGVTGNSGEMTFARNPMVVAKFKYKLVNIRNLHPSHIQGRLNPMHFIPEAQPKDRSGEDTAKAVNSFAFRPEVDKIILQPTSPYDAIPVVNTRGEVIQGNNRVEGIQLGYYSRNKTVRDYLLENLEQFGFTMEQAEEVGVDNLFIVREVNATDNYAIELGSYDVKDLETGGGRPIDPIAVSRRISFETKSSIFSVLFNNYENQTLNQLIRQNVKFLSDIIFPLINSATKNTITTNSVLNEDGIEGFEGIVQQFLFDGADPNTALLFAELPAVVQGGLMRSLPYIFSVGKQNSILPEVQKAILGFSDMRNKNMSFEDWATQIDMFNGGFANSQIYTPLEMKIIQIFSSAKTMNDIAGRPEVRKDKSSTPPENFFKYSMLARPKEVGLIFDDGIGGMGKAEAIMEVFKVPYNDRVKKQAETGQETVVEDDQRGQSEVGGVQNQDLESGVGREQETTGLDSFGVAKAKIGVDVHVKGLDASYKIKPISETDSMYKQGFRYEGTISYPESLGENGNYSDDNIYKEVPTEAEVIADIKATIKYELEQLNEQEYLSGRDENIKEALQKIDPKELGSQKAGSVGVGQEQQNPVINELSVARNAGISPKNFKDLYLAGMKIFGLDRMKAFASSVIMDRMVGVMAGRSGVSKEQMYDKLKFEKVSEEFVKDLSAKGRVLFQFIGENAQLSQDVRDNLQVARDMESSGKEAKIIRMATGWEKGKDGKWRYEIDDTGIKLNKIERIGNNGKRFIAKLSDIYENKELYSFYPQLKNVRVLFSNEKQIGNGAWEKAKNEITIYGDVENVSSKDIEANYKLTSVLLHEIQHTIQDMEGFAKGGNTNDIGLRNKLSEAGVTTIAELNEKIKVLKKEYSKIYQEWYNKAFFSGRYKGRKAETEKLLRGWIKIESDIKKLEDNTYDFQKAYDEYKRLAGEVESRNVESRMGMTSEQRRSTTLQETEDIARDEQIVLYQKSDGKAQGAAMISMDGQAIIYALTNPNVSTPLHEMAHIFEHYLKDAERNTINAWAGTKDWTTETSEKFARGFEKYLSEGIATSPDLQKIFDKFKQWLTEIYNGIIGSDIDIQLNDEMRAIYAQMLGVDALNKPVAPSPKELALGRGNAEPGDFVFNDSGQRYEIVSYDVNQQIYTISDENGNQYKVDPDMVIWTLQKNNIRNSVNHPDFNVSTVVSGDVNPEQRELGYAYKLDITYPMNTFDAIKAKSYYFKEMPGQEGISGTIQSFLAEMEQNIQKKPVQSAVDERVIDSLARLKERKLAARENKKEEEIMSVRDLANKGDDYIEGAFFSSLEKGDVFTINKKVYEVVSKSKEKITKDESRKTPGKIVTYRGYSITIKPPQRKGVKASLNANIVGKVLNGSWFSNSPQWGSLSRDISGEILTDLINERNPFHEKSGIYEKIQNYIDKVNQAPNNEGIQMGFEFPSSKEQEVDISPDVELELYQDSEVFKGKDIREMVVEMGSDQGGISDFTADRIEEYDYVVETIKISDLLQADEGLKEYIDNSNKVRKFKGLGFQMHPIVDIKGEVVDGYNRIHQRVIDGDQEVTVYKAIPKVDAEQEIQEDVVVDENNLPENNSEQINNILSFVNENQELVDEFFLQKGIDLSELITFTDENGNPC